MKQSTNASPRRGWRLSLIGSAHAQSAPASRSDEVKAILKPGDMAEVKAFMKVGDEMNWSWTTVGGKLNYEFHGEPLNAPSNVFTSYGKGSADKAEGRVQAEVCGYAWVVLAQPHVTDHHGDSVDQGQLREVGAREVSRAKDSAG
jgi:hypothetical protein